MNFIKYIKEKGMKHALEIIWKYKIDKVIQKIILLFVKNKPLKNIIVIESHNDFDNNGGAFYDYLIKNNYNDKYLIIWLLKNKLKRELPKNVKAYPIFSPSIRKNYYICVAKYFTSDCEVVGKIRNGQESYYLSHGTFSLKNSSGKIDIPEKVDYILIPSKFTEEIQKNQYRPKKGTKMISLGFPIHDKILQDCNSQLNKIINENKYKKKIIWMPTFRKGGGFRRNDSNIEFPLGIPLITNQEEYVELDNLLQKENILLIIKFHPMQDEDTIKIKESNNIKLITNDVMKKYNIDTYELIKETDALISDYSSIAYDYLMLNKPLAYIFSDLEEYKNGLITKEPKKFIAGPIIMNCLDMKQFILEVSNNIDSYEMDRINLWHKIYEFDDGNNCKRLAQHMGLESILS